MRIRNLNLIGAIFISAHSIVVAVCSKINGDNFSFHTFRVKELKKLGGKYDERKIFNTGNNIRF